MTNQKRSKLLFEPILIKVAGRATLLELKIKLLLSKNKYEVKRKTCSEVKNIIYDKFSKHLTIEDKQIIDEAVWIRNKLVHFEFSEILRKQKSIQSMVIEKSVDPKNADKIFEAITKMMEGKGNPVNEESSLYGQHLEFSSNPMRIQELNGILDKAIDIVTAMSQIKG